MNKQRIQRRTTNKIKMQNKYKCLSCGYEWLPRVDEPKECPNCKNRNWNIRQDNKSKE